MPRKNVLAAVGWQDDADIRNRLADSLLRDLAGFHDRNRSPTGVLPGQVPRAARQWLRSTRNSPAANALPSGYSVVCGDHRWAACVVVYVGSSSREVLSFAYWLLTSAHSKVCGGANLDISGDDTPVWTTWVH